MSADCKQDDRRNERFTVGCSKADALRVRAVAIREAPGRGPGTGLAVSWAHRAMFTASTCSAGGETARRFESRHGAVVAVVAVVLWGALTTWTSAGGPGPAPMHAQEPAADDASRTFAARCATCHGADGRGAERGPDIVTAPRAASRALADLERVIREGVPGGGMPASGLPAAETAALARHVRALAEGARTAPSWPAVQVTLRDGRTMSGLVLAESSFDLRVLTDEGTLTTLRRSDVLSQRDEGRRPLPTLVPRDDVPPSRPGEWLTYNGDIGGNRHSPLTEIAPANVASLQPAWTFAVPGARTLRTTPLVVGEVMYVTAPNEVHAIDARSGRQIWQYRRPRTPGVIGDAGAGVNRGVALRGDRLYLATDDARLVALHRATGQLLWDVVMADFREHYGATSAPLVVGDLVVSGVSGGDEGVRGFVAAFDAVSGREVWRFWTVPAPGEPGSETWQGKAIAHPCAATWLTGSYDPTLNLIFWTTGNPCPDYNGDERRGDNLWSNSVVALEPATGRMRWHFQFTPHDLNDWDAVQTVIVADVVYDGAPRRLLLQANRNGFFYVLDRETGQMLRAAPFVKNLNWASGIAADGRPMRLPGMEPSWRGTVVCPSVVGATNWMSPAFNPDTRLYYVQALERCSIFLKSSRWFEEGESFYGGSTRNVPGETGGKVLRAIDIDTGAIAWELPQIGSGETWSGVLSTASGLVFFGEDGGAFAAADARTGQLRWHFAANAVWRGSPMTYTAGGRQHVAIAGGGTIYAFALPDAAASPSEEM